MTAATTRFLVLLVLAVQAGAVVAQDTAAAPKTEQWECKYCILPQGVYGEAGAGGVRVTGEGDVYKAGRHTGLKSRGYVGLDATARTARAGNYVDLYATDLGLPTRALDLEGGKQGLFKLRFHAADLPLHISDSARTPFGGVGTDALSLPPYWVPGVTTGGMTALAGSQQNVTIESNRRQYGLGMALIPIRDWEFGVNVRKERRDGTRPMGSSFFFNSTQLVAPVDYATSDLEAYASYAARTWQVRLAYQASIFTDHKSSLRWDNPFAQTTPGATVGQLALPPDNQFHQTSASGAYQFTDRTRATASLALGRMEQNESFLPATVNPSMAAIALPRDSLQGRVDTRRTDVKLMSAVSERLGLNLAYVYDDRHNKTPQSTFNWVTTDMLAATPRANLPYSYTKRLYKASADYRLMPGTKASLGADRDVQDRSYQEVSKTTEDTVWGKFSVHTRERSELTLSYAHGRRTVNAYQAVAQISPPENPLLRKYNMADRSRDQFGLRVAATPVQTLTVGFDLSESNEDYSNSAVGLVYANRYGLGSDLSAQLREDTSVHVYYSFEEIKSRQAGAQSFSNPSDWTAENVDTVQTAGIGLKHALIRNRFDIGADLTTSHSVGDVKVSTGAAGPGFPHITSDLNSLKLHATYRLASGLAVQAVLGHERYRSRNWAVDGVGPSTMPSALTLGEGSPNYKVSVASLMVRYRF